MPDPFNDKILSDVVKKQEGIHQEIEDRPEAPDIPVDGITVQAKDVLDIEADDEYLLRVPDSTLKEIDKKLEMGDLQDLLSTSKLVATNGSTLLVSIDLDDWVAGKTNEVVITDDGDGSITISMSDNYLPYGIDGTPGQITVTDDGDGSVTLSFSQGEVVTVSDDYTVLEADWVLLVDTSSKAITVTIPSALVTDSFYLHVKDKSGDAATHNITIETGGSETIDGATSLVIGNNYWSYYLVSDGDNLFLI